MPQSSTENLDEPVSLAATGVAAYMVANIVHEVFGHSLVCVATGARITVLTSVFFHSVPGSRMTDAGGPMANLLFGLLLWGWMRRGEPARQGPPFTRFVLLMITVFNLAWVAGCFCQTGVSGHGDWGFVIERLHPAAFWRGSALITGVGLYWLALRTAVRGLNLFVAADEPDRGRRIFRLVAWPYFAAGMAACLAATLDQAGMVAAVRGAAMETLALNMPLLLVPLFMRRRPAFSQRDVIDRSGAGLAVIAFAFILFALSLGRGMRFGV